MAPQVDLVTPLMQVIEVLTAAGIRATDDPASVNVSPDSGAVLVQLGGFEVETLTTYKVTAGLTLLVADSGVTRSRAALADLFNKVTAADVFPDGPVVARTTQLPEGAALPSLVFPLNLET